MDGYRVKHILSYQQLADIINKLSFHNLNCDKNFVKYYFKKLKENYVDLLKIKKRNRSTVSDFLELILFVNSKKILTQRLENTSLESILNQIKELVSKRDDSSRKISSFEETISVENQRVTEDNSLRLQKKVEVKFLTETLKKRKN